jgi:hypothetical protein
MNALSAHKALPLVKLAMDDIGWIAVLTPLSLGFRAALVIASGYFAARTRGRACGALYASTVITSMAWVFTRLMDRGGNAS